MEYQSTLVAFKGCGVEYCCAAVHIDQACDTAVTIMSQCHNGRGPFKLSHLQLLCLCRPWVQQVAAGRDSARIPDPDDDNGAIRPLVGVAHW
jgi:hypothetical protein